jgi:hypothetical protein
MKNRMKIQTWNHQAPLPSAHLQSGGSRTRDELYLKEIFYPSSSGLCNHVIAKAASSTMMNPTLLFQGIELIKKGGHMDYNSRTDQAHTCWVYKTYKFNISMAYKRVPSELITNRLGEGGKQR